MPLYGVQCNWDCEEHGLSPDQRTFNAADDTQARTDFTDWVDALRLESLKPNSPKLKGTIQLYRLNDAGTSGIKLLSVDP